LVYFKIVGSKYKKKSLKTHTYKKEMAHMVNPSLGGTIMKPLQGMVKEPKTTKSFFWALFVKCFHNYNFFSCLSIACTNIWLEVYLGILKFYIPN